MKQTIQHVLVFAIATTLVGFIGHRGGASEARGTPVHILAEQARQALHPPAKPLQCKITHLDTNASISIEGYHGYRIVFSEYFTKYLPDPDPSPIRLSPSTNIEEFIEIVLFPLEDETPSGFANLIPWSGFESMYHVQPVDMGDGFGFHWFGRMHLWDQDDLRERLGLIGGDNRRELATVGLSIKDPGNMTANSMACRMDRFKPKKESHTKCPRIRLDSSPILSTNVGLKGIEYEDDTDLLNASRDSHCASRRTAF